MRTTLALDDDLLAEAQRLTGMTEKTALVRAALGALIEQESARRLARRGGTEPALADVPRRRAHRSCRTPGSRVSVRWATWAIGRKSSPCYATSHARPWQQMRRSWG